MKYVIITGANKGIGLATAHAFLEKGYTVIGAGRSEFLPKHADFHYFTCDVRHYNECEKLFETVVQKFGNELVCLVNNAGLGYAETIDDMTLDHWQTMFETNVNGVFYMAKLATVLMKQNGKGHIFNLSSIAGRNGIELMSGYCATKYAVTGFSHALYKELRKHGIKVTVIYPGSVNTPFFDNIPGIEQNPQMMRPEDIAQTIWNAFDTHANFHLLDIEMRPLKPRLSK